MTTNEQTQEVASRFAELKLTAMDPSVVIELRKLLEQLNVLDSDVEADNLKAEIEDSITLLESILATPFRVGQEVSLVGQSDYHDEAIDAVVIGFREHPNIRGRLLVDYRWDERSGGCALFDGTEAMLSWGKSWRIVPRVEAKREINPGLALKRMNLP